MARSLLSLVAAAGMLAMASATPTLTQTFKYVSGPATCGAGGNAACYTANADVDANVWHYATAGAHLNVAIKLTLSEARTETDLTDTFITVEMATPAAPTTFATSADAVVSVTTTSTAYTFAVDIADTAAAGIYRFTLGDCTSITGAASAAAPACSPLTYSIKFMPVNTLVEHLYYAGTTTAASSTVWHDATSSDFVLDLVLTGDGTLATTPPASFITVAGGSGAGAGTGYTVGAPTRVMTTLTGDSYRWQVTFAAAARGTYTIAFGACTSVKSGGNYASVPTLAGGASGACNHVTGTEYSVKIGFVPRLSVTAKPDGTNAVEFMDPSLATTAATSVRRALVTKQLNVKSMDHYVTVSTAGGKSLSSVSFATLADLFSVQDDDTTAYAGTYAAAAKETGATLTSAADGKITYKLVTDSTQATDAAVMVMPSGTLTDGDTVGNVATKLTVNTRAIVLTATLKYVSGADAYASLMPAAGVYTNVDQSTTIWHDATSKDLVVRLQMQSDLYDVCSPVSGPPYTGCTDNHAYSQLPTKLPDNFLTVTGDKYNWGVKASAGTATDRNPIDPERLDTYTWTITFSAAAAGTYTVNYKCPRVTGSDGTTLAYCDVASFTVKIGFKPRFVVSDWDTAASKPGTKDMMVYNAADNLGSAFIRTQWLDLVNTDYTLTVLPNPGARFSTASYGANPTDRAAKTIDTLAVTAAGGSTAYAGAYAAIAQDAATTQDALVYKLTAGLYTAYDTHDLIIAGGKLSRADGVMNYEYKVTLRAGWRSLTTGTNKLRVTSDTTDATTDNIWYADTQTIKMVLQYVDYGAATKEVATTAPAWSSSGLFAGATDLPGAASRAGGVTAVATAPVDPTAGYEYTLTTTGIAPGIYPIKISQGTTTAVLTSGQVVTTAYGAAMSVDLKIGLTTTVSVVDKAGKSLMKSATRTQPLAATRSVYAKVTMTAPAGKEDQLVAVYNFVKANLPTDVASLTLTSAGTAPVSAVATNVAFVEKSATTVSVYLALDLTNAAGLTTIDVVQGSFCDAAVATATICNAPSVSAAQVTLVMGVALDVASDASDVTDSTAAHFKGFFAADGDAYLQYHTPVPIIKASGNLIVKFAFTGTTLGTAPADKWAIATVAGPADLAKPDTIDYTSNVLTYTWNDVGTIAAGTYDITIAAESFTDAAVATIGNAEAKVRVVIGYEPSFFNADITSTSTCTEYNGYCDALRIKQRGTGGPFITYDDEVQLMLSGAYVITGETVKLTDVLSGVTDAKGSSVKASLDFLELTATAFSVTVNSVVKDSLVYKVGISGLPDGVYTFTLAECSSVSAPYKTTCPARLAGAAGATPTLVKAKNFKLIVDRTGPSAGPATYAGKIADSSVTFYTDKVTTTALPLPANMFNDTGSSDEFVKVTVSSTADHGMHLSATAGTILSTESATTAVALSSATLTTGPHTLKGPEATMTFTVKATDEAGNTNSSTFAVPIVRRSGVVLTAVDRRNAQAKDTLYTGSSTTFIPAGAAGAGRLGLTIIADFDEPVTGVTDTSLKCNVGAHACNFAGFTPVRTSLAGGKRYTWAVSIAATEATEGATIVFTLPSTGIVTVANSYEVTDAPAVSAVIDKTAPSTDRFIAPLFATEGVRYTLTLPTYFASDLVTTSDKIRVVSSSPASQFGLAFTSGVQGAATIAGIVAAQPPATDFNRVEFTLTVQDEAGNTATGVVTIRINAKPVNANSVAHMFSLSASSSLLTFTEQSALATFTAGSPQDAYKKNFDSAAQFRITTATGTVSTDLTVAAVYAYLIDPEADEAAVGTTTRSEILVASASTDIETAVSATAGDFADVAYAVDASTGEGRIGIKKGNAGLTAAAVQAWIRSLKYQNTRTDVTGSNRVLRVDVMYATAAAPTDLAVTASASRIIKVVATNNQPTTEIVATTHNTVTTSAAANGAKTFTEAGADVAIYVTSDELTLTVTDYDDDDYSGASVYMATSADATPTYGGCDKERDQLYLSYNYLGADTAPKVIASWSSGSCFLTLTPVSPATKFSQADLAEALKKVTYKNLDTKNPTGWVATGNALGKRKIYVKVADNGNKGKLADKLESTAAAANTVTLTIDNSAGSADDAAVLSDVTLFGQGGVLSSTDAYANIKVTRTAYTGGIRQKKFPVVLPAVAAAPDRGNLVVSKFTIDLRQDRDAHGAVIKGSFAGGQIYDPDTPGQPGTTPTMEIYDGSAWAPLTVASGAGARIAFANVFAGDATAATVYDTFTRKNNADATVTDTVNVKESMFDYRINDVSTLVLVTKINVGNLAVADLDEFKFRLNFGGANIEFYADVRRKACVDPEADGTVTFPSDVRTYTRVASLKSYIKNVLTDATAAGDNNYATGTTWADTMLPKFYPANELCKYPDAAVGAADDTATVVNRLGFDTKKTALAAASAVLDIVGASPDAKYAALKVQRNAARGAFGVEIAAGSLASRGSMNFKADTADITTVGLLPAVNDPTKESVDTNVAVRLQPPGTKFSSPVKVCIFTGDTPASSYKVLAVAEQRDPSDQSKGYTEWRVLQDQSFDVATGQVCAGTMGFSVFAPITRPMSTSPTVPKAHMMGGSCPNQCSGHGTCRQEGQCACFAGFEGYDCSMRTCPSAESWGEHQSTMHSMSECAGRGVCERSTGTCSCFDGYEGAACERAMCPNDCSGHGRCRTLAELPEVQKFGYSDWEAERMQVCVCDGGYQGADCSLRYCPYGDDPETICYETAAYSKKQVQRMSLEFATDPTGTGLPGVDVTSDEFVLLFTTKSGKNYTTPMIADIWNGNSDSVQNIHDALITLPEFAVTDVQVTAVAATTAQSLKVEYLVTFTGKTNTGNEALLVCPYNSQGSTGCNAPGCRPKFQQLRIFDTPILPNSVQVSAVTILQQPAPLVDNVGTAVSTAATANVYGVETTLVIKKYPIGSTGTYFYTYQFVSTKIFGRSQAVNADGVTVNQAAVTVDETPIPPEGLRKNVPGPYGLLIDFAADTQFGVDFGANGPWSYSFKWRLPTCTVTQESAADVAYEKAECANRGLCNRASGECECFTGYAGYNCAQQTVYV